MTPGHAAASSCISDRIMSSACGRTAMSIAPSRAPNSIPWLPTVSIGIGRSLRSKATGRPLTIATRPSRIRVSRSSKRVRRGLTETPSGVGASSTSVPSKSRNSAAPVSRSSGGAAGEWFVASAMHGLWPATPKNGTRVDWKASGPRPWRKGAILADRALSLVLDRRRSTLGGFFAFGSRSFLGRRELARLGIGIESLGEALGLAALFLGHLAQNVDALLLQLGFVVRAGDVRLDVDANLGVQSHLHVEHADRLDRTLEDDLRLVDVVTLGLERLGDVANVDRAVKLAGVRRGTNEHELGAVDIGAGLGGFVASRGVLGFEPLAIGFEDLAVGFVGAQRLLVRQQEVAGVAVLDGDHVADRAELLDAFEQDDFHDPSSSL